MGFLLYSVIYTVAVTLLFIPQYIKRPAGQRKIWLREKFGFIPAGTGTGHSGAIWVHAVSVGEVSASLPLLRALETAYPGQQIILSTVTDTGRQVALEKAPAHTTVLYLPFDLTPILRRCFRELQLTAFIVIETELWPNLFRVVNDLRIPLFVLNGRISGQSFSRYRLIASFMKKVLSLVDAFGMQTEIDAERITAIGAEEKKVRTTGNFKFDMEVSRKIPQWAAQVTGPVLVAGSTHRGEEELILSAYRENLERFPDLRLILAPRHPGRFREVEDILKSSGIDYVRRTELAGRTPGTESSGRNVILLDSIGELSSVYGIADIAIIGKSFTSTGGQNPLEPAFWEKPVLCGPHMENFPFMQEFYASGGACEVDASTLAKKIKELLIDPEKARASGKAARAVFLKYSGAVARSVEMIRPFLIRK